jgi:hypothetical protein
MKELTNKEYFEDLQAGSCFITALHQRTLEEVTESLNSELFDYSQLKDSAVYKYDSVVKRSKDYVFTRPDGTKSYRDFIGKNKYYTHKQILLHVNVQGEYTTIFINL